MIYLAGAMSCYGDDILHHTQWREVAKRRLSELGMDYYCPVDTWVKLQDNKTNENVLHNSSIVLQNKHYIDKSSAVLVCLDNIDKSMGTVYEISTAFNNHTDIIAFVDEDMRILHLDNSKFGSHFNYMVSKMYTDVDKALDVIEILYSIK